jgi:hypothetical protein
LSTVFGQFQFFARAFGLSAVFAEFRISARARTPAGVVARSPVEFGLLLPSVNRSSPPERAGSRLDGPSRRAL